MPTTKKKPSLGRPPGPIKVTLNVLVLEGTKTALEVRRMRSGLSIGQILDATFPVPQPAK